jgi:hypothetical protein
MLEYLVVAPEPEFRFDSGALVEAARRTWPDATVTVPEGGIIGERVDAYVDLPPPATQTPQLAFLTGGGGVSLDAPTREEAADVLAWLCASADIPDDGSVVVIHWLDDVVPLRAGLTAAELLHMQ